MLTLNDGRDELWQWDTGRTLAVDADCSQVHFSNKVFGRSIDVDVTDGVAIIPDILLQTDNDLNVWAFVGTAENGYTKISKTFAVNRRNKPADYVFTTTDQITLQTIQRQIGDLADLTTTAKDTLVAAINEVARTGGGAGSMELRVADGYVQYSTDGGMTWTNLIAMAELKGADGITPTIGDNGNWYLGTTDTGKPSRGETGPQGTPGIYYGTTQPTGDTHPVWIDPDGDHDDGGLLPAVTSADNGKVLRVVSSAWSAEDMPTGGTDMGITGATVGQIAKITAVDASGVPTAWAPVDMPTGGGENIFEKVVEMTTTEDAAVISISTGKNGNPLSMSEFYVAITTSRNSAATKNDYFLCNVLPDTAPKHIRIASAIKNVQMFTDVYCYVMHYKVVGGAISHEYVGRQRTRSSLNVAKYLENETGIGILASQSSTTGLLTPTESSTGVSKIDSAGKMYCITFDANSTECIFGAGTRVEVWAR